MSTILARLGEKRLLPVVVLERAEDAIPLASALLEAGLSVIEITLRTPAARDALRLVRREFPQMLVGAGTILDPEVVPELVAEGIDFGVAPGLNERVVDACATHGLPLTPGVITPTEVERARAYGLNVLKFFPAEPAGGAKMLAALSGPYGHTGVMFIPTGGIHHGTLRDYLGLKTVLAVGGSWFVDKKLYADGDFSKVAAATKAAVESATS